MPTNRTEDIEQLDRRFREQLSALWLDYLAKRRELIGAHDEKPEQEPVPPFPLIFLAGYQEELQSAIRSLHEENWRMIRETTDYIRHELRHEYRRVIQDTIDELNGDFRRDLERDGDRLQSLNSIREEAWKQWDQMTRTLVEQAKQTKLMLLDFDASLRKVQNIPKILLETPLVGKLDLRLFLRISARKVWELKVVWLAIVAVVFLSAFGVDAKSGDQTGTYSDSLYTAWMAFTTVGFGDWHPATWYARIVSILLAILGIITIGLFVTIIWSAALEAARQPPVSE